MSIFLLGPPCAGKTTVAKALSEFLGDEIISAGSVARKLGTSYSTVQEALDRGQMAPEGLMNATMLTTMYENKDRDVIYDGYPRYWEQFGDVLVTLKPPNHFIHLYAPDPVLMERNFNRGRNDRTVFMERMRLFEIRTTPMIGWLQHRGLCLDIENNSQHFHGIDQIVSEICQHIEDNTL